MIHGNDHLISIGGVKAYIIYPCNLEKIKNIICLKYGFSLAKKKCLRDTNGLIGGKPTHIEGTFLVSYSKIYH